MIDGAALPTGGGDPGLELPRVVVATRNPGKLGELRRLLAPRPVRLLGLDEAGVEEDTAEPGPGYAENAMAKAVAACRATGLPAIADDSGIEVLALGGWPGPESARWLPGSDADRLHGLLGEVARRCPGDPRARYVAAVVLARPGSEPILAHGSCDGTMVAPRGTGGFGYDPGFLSSDLGITFAEASPEQKDTVSHRARAIQRLRQGGAFDRL